MEWLVLGAVGAFASHAVGGLVGFASSLLFLPVLLLLDVPLPVAVTVNLVLAIVTRLPTVVALRHDVDVRRTATMLAGSLPGMGLGAATVALVPQQPLEVAAGALVLATGCWLLCAPAPAAGLVAPARTTALAGACSGWMGVTTSLNGVPPAVLLARSGASVRTRLADLSAFFAIGNCVTLAVLSVQGAPELPGAAAAVWLVAGVVGNACGLRAAQRLDPRRFELLTVVLVLGSGVACLVGALRG